MEKKPHTLTCKSERRKMKMKRVGETLCSLDRNSCTKKERKKEGERGYAKRA
jgi:hypothetical protein